MPKAPASKTKPNSVMIKHLTDVMSDVYVLAVKAHVYHWNVKGPQFAPLHAFFETQYKGMPDVADAVAERIRMLGPLVNGGMAAFLANTVIKEASTKPMQAKAMLKDYMQGLQAVRGRMAAAEDFADSIDDIVTQDLMVRLMGDFDKTIWMLQSQLA
ncbi:MAG: DNA starvation/stationary phase protection protein [Alphaproteobacteria bacterium]|nr:DNA starvation/stationary phase protection protein [Alphaproteobacteria bacterium]